MVRRPTPDKSYKNVDATMEFTTHQYLILTVHQNGGFEGGAIPDEDGKNGGATERFELKYVSLSCERREVPVPEPKEEKDAEQVLDTVGDPDEGQTVGGGDSTETGDQPTVESGDAPVKSGDYKGGSGSTPAAEPEDPTGSEDPKRSFTDRVLGRHNS